MAHEQRKQNIFMLFFTFIEKHHFYLIFSVFIPTHVQKTFIRPLT